MHSITDLVRGMRDTRLPVLPVAIAAVLAAGLYVFFEIAEEVREAEVLAFDRAALLWLRDPADLSTPVGPAWLEQAMMEITALGGYPVLVIMVGIVLGYLLLAGMRGPALFVFVSIVTGAVAGHLLKLAYDRPRPDVVDHLVSIHTSSFPSGHATMSAVVYLTLAALIIRLVGSRIIRFYVLAVATTLTLAIGFSRVYLGVHWPSDVLAGWAIGVAWACLSWLVVTGLRYMGRLRD